MYSSNRNLKYETIKILSKYDKMPQDIRWVGCNSFKIPIEEFWKLADRMYDAGYGGQEVAKDLIVVGDNWWLERHEYDGAEWWEYKQLPQEPKETLSPLSTKPWAISLFPEEDTDYNLFYLSDFKEQYSKT